MTGTGDYHIEGLLVSASAAGVRPFLLLFICAGTAVLG